jgi:thiol-disulfide isomerase/thioredoxin
MVKNFFILLLFFSLNAAGQKVTLLSLDQLYQRIEKGKDTTFVINFWATWCAPCVKEIPCFEKLQTAYKSDQLKVLLISLDFKSKIKSTVLPYVKRKKIKNEVFLLNETDQQVYINRIDSAWSGALPATLMIRKNSRKFFEKDFEYAELLKEYQNIKQS